MTGLAPDVAYNPFEPGFTDDPYPAYAALREHDPVHQSPFGIWLLFRYDDVRCLLRDTTLSVEDANAKPNAMSEMIREIAGDRADRGSYAMLNRDAPDHTRLRRLVSKVFTPRAVERLRPRIDALVHESLDQAAARGEMDVIADLAFPLPFTVISEMLGMPEVDHELLRTWSGLLVRTLEPINDPDVVRDIGEAGDAMRDLLTTVVAQKRQAPAGDLLSALIAAEDDGDVLSDEELLDQVMLLYIAGHETTVNLIGNGMLALLRNPEQLEGLRGDPSLVRAAVDELLRFDSPVQRTARITNAEVELGGKVLPKGAFVVAAIGAANRDPAHFADPDRLDVARADNRHIAFGFGIHFCLGAPLARVEGQIALQSLLRRMPRLRLAGPEPEWRESSTLRGLKALPVAF